jgi:hypothetical protein
LRSGGEIMLTRAMCDITGNLPSIPEVARWRA